jgi:hypothetical protein
MYALIIYVAFHIKMKFLTLRAGRTIRQPKKGAIGPLNGCEKEYKKLTSRQLIFYAII